MSHLPAVAEQLSLAGIQSEDGAELLTVDADKASNRCTASSLAAREGLRASILSAVAEGFGTRRVSAAFGVSREVVRALKRQAIGSGELDHVRKELAAEYFALAHAAVDRMRDEIEEMPRASLPIVAGVSTDKGQVLSGGVTSRVERKEGVSVGDLAEWMKTALQDSSIDVSAQPVTEGSGVAQKASPVVVALPALAAGVGQNAESVDNKSTVICPLTKGGSSMQAEGGRNKGQKETAA
jgi:hypothetical protein